jgi:MFS family permease
VSIAGAATVLSFAVIADYFPKEFAARANGALNLLHFGWAFTMQYGIGLVVEQWPSQGGHYPVAAYQAAFGLSLALQVAALIWFAVPWLRSFVRHLYLLFAPRHAGPDDQLALVPTAAEGVVLEASQGVEW